MIELVAAALRSAGLEPTWEDVADTLWLAREMGRHKRSADPDETKPRTARSNQSSSQIGLTSSSGHETPHKAEGQTGRNTPPAAATLYMPPAPGTPMPHAGLPFRTPTATALPGALALGHALRPLKRRVPSATTLILDDEATAERAADEGIWTPILRPALTRWLDVALVIDQSPSMAIWARTVEELRRLLESHGAFRDVRIWLLDTDTADRRPTLYAGTQSATSHARPSTPRELVDPGGRRLILMVSDCVAPAWASGAVPALLSVWGQASPVAIVHMLPQRLWRYTAIETEPADLRAPYPGAPNAQLDVSSWSSRTERELQAVLAAAENADPATLLDETTAPFSADPSVVTVPVIELQPSWVSPWANLVAAAGGRQVSGVVIRAKPSAGEPTSAPEATELEPLPISMPAAERVRRFRAVVSPTAFELAGYLAATAPLTLPVMRLIQQAMLPGSAQVHLAEVLLGGLLERCTPVGSEIHPDEVRYAFIDGAAELLQRTVLSTDTLRVIHTVGEFVGRTQTFPSLLYAPDDAPAGSLDEQAFAAVTARTLRHFGASYEELALGLEEKAQTGVAPYSTPRSPGGERKTQIQQLELVKEAKVFDILPGSLDPRLEASGVLAKDGLFYVIFDNLPHIACISPELSRTAGGNHMIMQEKGHRFGFRDVAYDSRTGRFYVVIESLPRGRGTFMAAVQEYDENLRYTGIAWLDFPLDRPNKGLRGLACVHREGQTYLLGLCAGNRCRGGAAGRVPGGGRIYVFRRGRRDWDRVARIRLPETVLFTGYSGMAVAGDRIAVVSRQSSALWLGRLAPDGWQVTGAGMSYALPRAADGSFLYGTAVGVSWTAPDQVVIVSDKAKPDQDRRSRAKDQSIHIFRIPAPAVPLSDFRLPGTKTAPQRRRLTSASARRDPVTALNSKRDSWDSSSR